jgi:hypothetical protein
MPDTLTLGLLIVAAVALGLAAGALALALHIRTRVYALEQLQGLTTRRIRVIAEHVGIPLAVERRRGRKGAPPDGQERRHPLTDGPVPEGTGRPWGSVMASEEQMAHYRELGRAPRPEGLGGHPRIELPVTPETAGDEQRLEEPVRILHRPPPTAFDETSRIPRATRPPQVDE